MALVRCRVPINCTTIAKGKGVFFLEGKYISSTRGLSLKGHVADVHEGGFIK